MSNDKYVFPAGYSDPMLHSDEQNTKYGLFGWAIGTLGADSK